MTVEPRAVVAELRAQGTHPTRACDPSDFSECERRVREALRRARARQWARCHWWGFARDERATG